MGGDLYGPYISRGSATHMGVEEGHLGGYDRWPRLQVELQGLPSGKPGLV